MKYYDTICLGITLKKSSYSKLKKNQNKWKIST
jgi:hypothetical protein